MKPYRRIAAGLLLVLCAGGIPAYAANVSETTKEAPQETAAQVRETAPAATPPEALSAAPLRVIEASTLLDQGVHLLDADIVFALDDELIEALASGVALYFDIEIEVRRDRAGLWEDDVASLRQRYRVEYHALSRLYLVTHPVTGIQTGYGSPSSALHAVGTLRRLPLIDDSLLLAREPYTVRLRARLVTEALPLPLRFRSWFSGRWRPASEWFTVPLR